MQNIDFYERKNIRVMPPQFADTYDPEYLPRVAQHTPREMERVRKKASRVFFLISALCIISFTAGIVIGIKFTGGTQREIVDKKTFNAVASIGKNLPFLGQEKQPAAEPRENMFPKSAYPYVIKMNRDCDYAESQKIASFLSHRGHTVILAKADGKYRIYIGPYKTADAATESLKKISTYTKYSLAENTRIIKR
jgi:hypothetical protein